MGLGLGLGLGLGSVSSTYMPHESIVASSSDQWPAAQGAAVLRIS